MGEEAVKEEEEEEEQMWEEEQERIEEEYEMLEEEIMEDMIGKDAGINVGEMFKDNFRGKVEQPIRMESHKLEGVDDKDTRRLEFIKSNKDQYNEDIANAGM